MLGAQRKKPRTKQVGDMISVSDNCLHLFLCSMLSSSHLVFLMLCKEADYVLRRADGSGGKSGPVDSGRWADWGRQAVTLRGEKAVMWLFRGVDEEGIDSWVIISIFIFLHFFFLFFFVSFPPFLQTTATTSTALSQTTQANASSSHTQFPSLLKLHPPKTSQWPETTTKT